jgi:hypothetical protein
MINRLRTLTVSRRWYDDDDVFVVRTPWIDRFGIGNPADGHTCTHATISIDSFFVTFVE